MLRNNRSRSSAVLVLAMGLFIGIMGCKDDDPVRVEPPALDPMPDFSLMDANASSPTFDLAVSPRDHLQRVSAWYFGHST